MRVAEVISVRIFRVNWKWLTTPWWHFLTLIYRGDGVEPNFAHEEAD